MSHELHVAKRAQAVRILLDDGSVVPATVFLPGTDDGPPLVQEIPGAVEEAGPALPCVDGRGSFMVLGTTAIVAVSVPAEDTWEDGFFFLRAARVKLRGGHELEGLVRHDLGNGDRLSDALRRTDAWVQMEVDDDVIWFRVDQLLMAVELETGDDPAGPAA